LDPARRNFLSLKTLAEDARSREFLLLARKAAKAMLPHR